MSSNINQFKSFCELLGLDRGWNRIVYEPNPDLGEMTSYDFVKIPIAPIDKLIKVIEAEECNPNFIQLNPLKPGSTRKTLDSVLEYRNILIEIDIYPDLKDQFKHISITNKMPWTTCTYSGGKSLHFIISLDEPLDNLEEYKEWVNKIHYILMSADLSTKDPTKFTRVPGAFRYINGSSEDLILQTTWAQNRPRVTRAQMKRWFSLYWKQLHYYYEYKKLEEQESISKKVGKFDASKSTNNKAPLTNKTKAFLEACKNDTHINDWRKEAFFAMCDAARSGYDLDEMYDMLLVAVNGDLAPDSQRIHIDAYNSVVSKGQLGIKLIK